MATQFPTPSALLCALSIGASLALPGIATANDVDDLVAQGMFCSATARAEFHACGNGVLDDYWIALAICINESDAKDRTRMPPGGEGVENREQSTLQPISSQGRLDACSELGEHRYDPEFEPALFEKQLRESRESQPLFSARDWQSMGISQRDAVHQSAGAE